MPFYHSPILPFYHQFPRVRTCVVHRCRPPLRQSSQTGHTATLPHCHTPTLPHCPSPSPTRRVQTANRSVCSLYILYPANRLVYASRPAGTPGHFNKVKTFDSSIYFFFANQAVQTSSHCENASSTPTICKQLPQCRETNHPHQHVHHALQKRSHATEPRMKGSCKLNNPSRSTGSLS